MQQLLFVFYVLFFATGFMGAAALLVLGLRVRSTLTRPLLVFQVLFLIGLGLVLLYLTPAAAVVAPVLLGIAVAVNAGLYGIVILLVRRLSSRVSKRRLLPVLAVVFSALVICKSLANIALSLLAVPLAESPAWSLAGYILSGLAMAFFGLTAMRFFPPGEPRALLPLIKAYGACALIFSPMGLVEWAVEIADLPGLPLLSLDHFFYLAWNIVSMTAAVRLFKPSETGEPALDDVPEERVRALGLSAREREMAVLISRGLSNKEIAAELHISPATVRTHIYNLYQKVGAGSRVELLNMLRR